MQLDIDRRASAKPLAVIGACLAASIALSMLLAFGLSIRAPQEIAALDVLVESFRDMAMRHDYAPDNPYYRMTNKWIVPIRVVMPGEWPPEHRAYAWEKFKLLERLTRLDIRDAGTGLGNFVMHFAAPEDYRWMAEKILANEKLVEEMMRIAQCWAGPYSDKDGSVSKTVAVLQIKKGSNPVRTCIAHEITHGFGIRGHGSHFGPSVLTDSNELTVNDKLLIRTLYDWRISPGMTREQALPVVRRVMAELLRRVEAQGEDALYQK